MRIISTDVVGSGQVISISAALVAAGYTLPHPSLAYKIILVESAQGATAARMGGPDVGASKGVPFTASGDKIVLEALLGMNNAPSRVWNTDIHYLYIPTGDTVSVGVWCD